MLKYSVRKGYVPDEERIQSEDPSDKRYAFKVFPRTRDWFSSP